MSLQEASGLKSTPHPDRGFRDRYIQVVLSTCYEIKDMILIQDKATSTYVVTKNNTWDLALTAKLQIEIMSLVQRSSYTTRSFRRVQYLEWLGTLSRRAS